MYDIKFYLLVWFLVTLVGFPTILITWLVLLMKKIRAEQALANALETKLQNIDFLQNLIRADSSNEDKQMAFDSFNKYFANFKGLDPKGTDFQKRIRFISDIALLEYFEIDKVSKFSETLGNQNRDFKKDIERAIGGSLKARQKAKK
ncbi:MAG: hypothetical protein K2N12_09240 [Helicobacter sp.]|nr:hypothetical protein [Helicobacter sp.]